MDFTESWAWPQWALAGWIFVALLYSSHHHGTEKLEGAGDRKGLPEKYNAFVSFLRAALILFVLIAGGFFA